ncbi:RHS repeat-associated core domain-containing protein [Chryseobacterium sp. NFX27]
MFYEGYERSSVRVNYTNNGSGAAIIEENNYYPFGLKHEGYNTLTGNPAYNYGYNGKELQKETGWSDYGARMYMSDIGRWGVIDPLAEQMRRFSPYNYAFNNPVNFVDPDGRAPYNPRDVYGEHSAFNGDFDPNSSLSNGGGNFGGIFQNSFYNSGMGSIMGGNTFGETQAYRDLMSGRTSSITNSNGYLTYWTGAMSSSGSPIGDEMNVDYDLGVIHKLRLMDDNTVDNLNFINDRIGDFGSLLELTRTQGGSIAFWTTPIRSRAFDGITYSRLRLEYYRNNWGGNGYTGATTSVAKYIGKGALVGQIALGAIEIGNGAGKDYNDYYKQGGTGGKNAVIASVKVTTGATMGYLAGIGAGMAYGAVMGSSFPIVGTIIGAIVGGVVGYYSSEFVGGLMEKNIE